MAAWLLWLCPYLFRRPGTISLFVVVVAFPVLSVTRPVLLDLPFISPLTISAVVRASAPKTGSVRNII